MLEEKHSVGFVADVHSDDLEKIFKLIAKTGHKNTVKSTLINITQNRFMMCASPFSKKLEEKCVHNCPDTNPEMSALQIQNSFRKEKKVAILKASNKTVVLTHGKDLAFAEIIVRRNIIYNKTQLRRIDCKTLVKLLEHFHTRCAAAIQSLNGDDRDTLRTASYSVTDIKPRHMDRRVQKTSVCTYYDVIYKNPLMPIEYQEDEYLTEAKGDAMDYHSMPRGTDRQSGFGEEARAQYSSLYSSGFAQHMFDSSRSFNSTIPRYDVYASSDRRRLTFQTTEWKVSEKPDIDILVDQGFFLTGPGDLVRCFMCGIGLKDWVKDDDVVKEHAKHSSKCAHLLQTIGKPEVDRIQADLSSGESSSLSGDHLPYKIRSPQYQKMDARIATFRFFPSRIHIQHQELAVAGLFFTGKADLCRCFTCDGGLKDWSDGDDPCMEHATYFSHCEYINQLKGKDYIRDMQQRRRQKRQLTGGTIRSYQRQQYSSALLDISSPAGSGMVFRQLKDMGYSDSDVMVAFKELKKKGVPNPTADKLVNTILDMHEQRQAEGATAAANATTDPKDDSNTIKEENKRLAQVIQCMLCLDEEPDVLFLPCTHHIICHMCSQKIKYCPVCKAQIMESIRTYRV